MLLPLFAAPVVAPPQAGEEQRGTAALLLPDRQGAESPLPPGVEARKTDELRPHPAMVQCNLLPTAVQLEPLHKVGMRVFELPLLICHDGTIIDGYKRWMIARDLEHPTLMCMVLDKSEEDALRLILEKARSRNYLNPFCRIALALKLVEPLAAQARENRVLGGRKKQLAKLPKAQKIDVRKEAARLACGVAEWARDGPWSKLEVELPTAPLGAPLQRSQGATLEAGRSDAGYING